MVEKEQGDATDVESEYLTAGEAAKLLMVSPKTVTRWADGGRIPHAVTLGGHRRFRREDIVRLAESMTAEGDRTRRP
jgi:excisionase family DNA binding protein